MVYFNKLLVHTEVVRECFRNVLVVIGYKKVKNHCSVLYTIYRGTSVSRGIEKKFDVQKLRDTKSSKYRSSTV